MSSLPPRLLAVYRPFRCNRPASRYSHAATPGAILRRRTQPPVSILICCARGSSNYSGLAAVVFVLSLLSARSLRSVHPFRSLRLVRRIERPNCSDVIALSRTQRASLGDDDRRTTMASNGCSIRFRTVVVAIARGLHSSLLSRIRSRAEMPDSSRL